MFVPLSNLAQQIHRPMPGCIHITIESDVGVKLYAKPNSNSRIFKINPNIYYLHICHGDVIEQLYNTTTSNYRVSDINELVVTNRVQYGLNDGLFRVVETIPGVLEEVQPDPSYANLTSLLFNKGEDPVKGIDYNIIPKAKLSVKPQPADRDTVGNDTILADMDMDLSTGVLRITLYAPRGAHDVFSVDVDTFMRIVPTQGKAHVVLIDIDDPKVGFTEDFKQLIKRK